jgi:branched-subunit amino acid aminotransferase/4-amino-4-deoxychorismate lyase
LKSFSRIPSFPRQSTTGIPDQILVKKQMQKITAHEYLVISNSGLLTHCAISSISEKPGNTTLLMVNVEIPHLD